MSNSESHVPIRLGRLQPHERMDYRKVLEQVTKRIGRKGVEAVRVALVADKNTNKCELCSGFASEQLRVEVEGSSIQLLICADFKDCDERLAKHDEREARRVIAHMKEQMDLG